MGCSFLRKILRGTQLHIILPSAPNQGHPWAFTGRGAPSQGLKVGSCLTLRNELSEKAHKLTKQKTVSGPQGGEQQGTQEACSATWPQSYYGNGANLWVVSGQSLCLAHIWSDSGSLLMGPPVVRQLMSKLSLCLAKADGFSQPFPDRPVGLRCFSL